MKKKSAPANRVIVTVTDEALPTIKKLAAKLGRKGLDVDQVMEMTGVITGNFTGSDSLKDLEKMEGVMSIEKEISAELPPNDSELQ